LQISIHYPFNPAEASIHIYLSVQSYEHDIERADFISFSNSIVSDGKIRRLGAKIISNKSLKTALWHKDKCFHRFCKMTFPIRVLDDRKLLTSASEIHISGP
jgi:hypothetical protein